MMESLITFLMLVLALVGARYYNDRKESHEDKKIQEKKKEIQDAQTNATASKKAYKDALDRYRAFADSISKRTRK